MGYLETSDRFYSEKQLASPRYSKPYPNAEEAIRAGAVLVHVARHAERFTSAGTRPRILEVGCGRGWLANLISSFGPTVAIDPATEPIAMARQHFPHVTFRQAVLGELLAENGFEPFDVVVSSEVLEHVPWAHKEQFLGELSAALAAGGICVLTTPRGEMFRTYRRERIERLQPVEDWLTERQLRRLATRCGFKVLDLARVRPRRFGLPGRIALSSKLRRALEAVGLGSLRAAVESHFCHYQIVLLTPGPRP